MTNEPEIVENNETAKKVGSLRSWVVRAARSRYAEFWLFIDAVAEASFFPIPPEVFLLTMIIAGARFWWYQAFLATTGSVIGGVLGYGIGAVLHDTVASSIISTYGLESAVENVGQAFNDNAFWAVFSAAFTPIPYKVFTISAGLFMVPFHIFVIASILGRGLRYFLLAYIAHRHGRKMTELIFKYINWISLAIALLGAVWMILKIMNVV